MKVYRYVKINMKTGKTVLEDFFQYSGAVVECKGGGGGGGSSVDKEYNAGMLAISQDQQAMADKLFNQYMYGVEYDPHETVAGYEDAQGNFVEVQGSGNVPTAYQGNEVVQRDGRWGEWGEGEYSDVFTELPQGAYAESGPEGENIVTRTRGEIEGYDDSGITSEAEYMQNIIEQNQELLGDRTELERGLMSADLAAAGLSEDQATRAQEVLEYSKTQGLGEAEVDNQLAQAGLSEEQATRAQEVLEYSKTQGLGEAEVDNQLAQAGLSEEQAKEAKKLVSERAKLSKSDINLGLAQNRQAMELMPHQTELGLTRIKDTLSGIRERAPVRKEFYSEALEGVDIGERKSQAQAGVEHAFAGSGDATRRELMSFGLNPGDQRYRSMANQKEIEKSKAIAGARKDAQRKAEDEEYARLRDAMTIRI